MKKTELNHKFTFFTDKFRANLNYKLLMFAYIEKLLR